VLVIDGGQPRNAPAAHLHGFLSRDGYPPAQLLAAGRREVRSYGGEIEHGIVQELVADGASGFRVVLDDRRQLRARRVLVATGLRDELPPVPGLRDRWGVDVLHCPYCHGYEVRDRRLAVLGGTDGAVRFAQIVRQWSHHVSYFSPVGALDPDDREAMIARGIDVIDGSIDHLVVDEDRLRGVQLDDGCVIACDAVFVPPRFVPNSGLLARLGCSPDDAGWVVTDATGRTSVPGVWAAGNVVDPRAQLITAAGAGSAAAIALNGDLVDEDVRAALAAPSTQQSTQHEGKLR
jgi:thioredoxin reductase